MDYKERIEEYKEEIEITKNGIKAYKAGDSVMIALYETDKTVFNLELEVKKKEALLLQLTDKMKQSEIRFKEDFKHMKANWKKILKNAMDVKDRFPKDLKRMVIAIKDKDTKKAWLSDEHKLQAYKTLRNILNENSNGKSV